MTDFERPDNRQQIDIKSNVAVDGSRNARPIFGRRLLRPGRRKYVLYRPSRESLITTAASPSNLPHYLLPGLRSARRVQPLVTRFHDQTMSASLPRPCPPPARHTQMEPPFIIVISRRARQPSAHAFISASFDAQGCSGGVLLL